MNKDINKKTYPRKFSHIGISVKNIEDLVKWYEKVLGFYILMRPTIVKNEDKTAIGKMCKAVFGDNFKDFKIAHMSTIDGIGIELFEFPETPNEDLKFNPYKKGIFHLSIQDPNIEDLVDKIVKNGGKSRMPIMEYYPDKKPYKMVYMEDPWGNIIEIYTHSYELHYFSGAYN